MNGSFPGFNSQTDLEGSSYYRARYYDPQAGRFLNEDPIGIDGQDVNYYRFVGNSPTLYVDPLGLFSWTYKVTYHDDGWYGLMQGTTTPGPPTLTSKCEPVGHCKGGEEYKLTFNVSWKIYVDAGKGWQMRHEQGHVQIMEDFFNGRTEYYHNHYEGIYPSLAACQAAAKKLSDSIISDLKKDFNVLEALQIAHDDWFQNSWNWLKGLF
jgi:RHS repeat-associated protein